MGMLPCVTYNLWDIFKMTDSSLGYHTALCPSGWPSFTIEGLKHKQGRECC